MRAQFKPGNIATTGQTICYGTTAGAISSSTAASGGSGSFSYEWRRNGTSIGNNNAAYTPSAYNTTAGAQTFTRWAKDESCNTGWVQSAGQWVLTVHPAFTAGAITTASIETLPGSPPANNPTNVTVASGGFGTITYEWRRTGSNPKTLANSNASGYTISSDASNYDTEGTHTFTRYARDATCNNSFTASSGQYTLKVGIFPPPGSGTATWTCAGRTWSAPLRNPAGCTQGALTVQNVEGNQYLDFGSNEPYFYDRASVDNWAATLCPSPWVVASAVDFVLPGCSVAIQLPNTWGSGGWTQWRYSMDGDGSHQYRYTRLDTAFYYHWVHEYTGASYL